MKHFFFSIIFFLCFSFVFADEPPSWIPYKKASKNSDYFAWVDFADNDTLKYPWKREWNLTVYKKDSTIFWQRNFNPTGYDDGIITDNGENFVIIEFWYYDKGNVVNVYNKDSNDFFIKGSDFEIPEKFLQETVSHRLWRKRCEITENTIFIETLDKSKWSINLDNQKMIKESEQRPIQESGNQSRYLILTIIVSMAIVLGLVILKTKRKV